MGFIISGIILGVLAVGGFIYKKVKKIPTDKF